LQHARALARLHAPCDKILNPGTPQAPGTGHHTAISAWKAPLHGLGTKVANVISPPEA